MMFIRRLGAAKPAVVLGLVVLLAAALFVLTKEMAARKYCENINSILAAELVNSLTDDEVHEKIGATPTVTRTPSKSKFAEEYTKKGPLKTYTVYAYYRTGAAKLLEAVSLNQKLADWEKE